MPNFAKVCAKFRISYNCCSILSHIDAYVPPAHMTHVIVFSIKYINTWSRFQSFNFFHFTFLSDMCKADVFIWGHPHSTYTKREGTGQTNCVRLRTKGGGGGVQGCVRTPKKLGGGTRFQNFSFFVKKKLLHHFFYKQSIFDPRPENCLSFSTKKLPQKIV